MSRSSLVPRQRKIHPQPTRQLPPPPRLNQRFQIMSATLSKDDICRFEHHVAPTLHGCSATGIHAGTQRNFRKPPPRHHLGTDQRLLTSGIDFLETLQDNRTAYMTSMLGNNLLCFHHEIERTASVVEM